ncbi:GEVED domain-containing protein [Phaeodactylibacter luteus]|uniref:Fibronectin type-III domain-containing protein n=1 Tax=Phaeodactylibacter luteus TaxID=1564516 RepID=A0A5C6RIF4_9BACT|nr:GEVED domain-containing protein [Phaeodactylibacter luteus]TXB61977.1 hypothetical protein FRY97_16290 [Phaeodactylibacter luteus]
MKKTILLFCLYCFSGLTAQTLPAPGADAPSQAICIKWAEGTVAEAENGQLQFLTVASDTTGFYQLAEIGHFSPYIQGINRETLLEYQSTAQSFWDQKTQASKTLAPKKVADFNTYFYLTIRPGFSIEEALERSRQIPAITYAGRLPEAVAPPLPPGNFVPNQTYLTAAHGIGADWVYANFGEKGQGLRIVDIEYSFNANHFDLPNVSIVGGTSFFNGFGNDHGTAVLGILGGRENSFGITGIVPQASLYFAGAHNSAGQYDIANSVLQSLQVTSVGDFLLIEQQVAGPNQTGSGQTGLVAVEYIQPYYDAIVLAVGNGRNVVEAAGNGSQNLDANANQSGNNNHYPFSNANDSGAIIVGAGASAPTGSQTARSRLWFSNYGSRVNLQGFGENVWTTGDGDAYDNEGPNYYYTSSFGGTSSASPIVLGAAALVQAIQIEQNGGPLDPLQLRGLLVSTGLPQQSGQYPASQKIGPLPNLENALEGYLGESCSPPTLSQIFASNITSSSARLNCTTPNVDFYDWAYRPVGGTWVNIDGTPTNSATISNLAPGQTYEYVVAVRCGSTWSEWSQSETFTTPGFCPPATGIEITSQGYSHFQINWDNVSGVDYNVRYRRLGDTDWIFLEGFSGHTSLNKLPCTTYEWQVQSVCDGVPGPWSSSLTVPTLGCGDDHCYAYGNSFDNWIERVALANLSNPSGNGYGHSDFTPQAASLQKGQSYTITLDPDESTNATANLVYWRVWADFNGDADFNDAGEQIVSKTSGVTAPTTANFTVPAAALTGQVRMRVAMSTEGYPTPCQVNGRSDVEDYSLNLSAPACNPPTGIALTSNGYSHFVVNWDNETGVGYNVRFRQQGTASWSTFTDFSGIISLNKTPCSFYEVQVQSVCDGVPGPWSSSLTVPTLGCGDDHCYAYGNSFDNWIERVALANLSNPSGNGYGHSDFTPQAASLQKGQSYTITLDPDESTNATANLVYWRVWADFNGDADFNDAGEQIVSKTSGVTAPTTANFTVPAAALTGQVRMRVAMSTEGYPTPCQVNGRSDVEDYSLNLSAPACNPPTGIALTSNGYSHFVVNWDNETGVGYNVRFRQQGTASWSTFTDFSGIISLNKTPCSFYEVQVQSVCDGVPGPWSSSLTVPTLGCGDDHCYAYGNSFDNWIERVALANLSNPSGNGYGHSDFTPQSASLQKGQSYTITLDPDESTNATANLVYWRVWADFNGDADFNDAGEQIVSKTSGVTAPTTANFTVPAAALTGQVRMRVAMSTEGYPTPCQVNGRSDVEDYSLNLSAPAPTLTVTPNSLTFQATGGTQGINITANNSWSISIPAGSQSWLSASPGTGSGSSSQIICQPNPSPQGRSATIVVNSSGINRNVQIFQEGATPLLSASPTNIVLPPEAGSTTFQVSANVNWQLNENVGWITGLSPGSGSGPATVTLSYTANPLGTSRFTSVALTDPNGLASPVAISVTQQANTSCDPPGSAAHSGLQPTRANFTWPAVDGASLYFLDIRIAGTAQWASFEAASNLASLAGFSPCTSYEYRIRTDCGDGASPVLNFQTTGCSPYCESYGLRNIRLID